MLLNLQRQKKMRALKYKIFVDVLW